jgi:hypothetical protein
VGPSWPLPNPLGRSPGPPQVWFPQRKPFTGANGDVDWFLRQISDLLVPPMSMTISPDMLAVSLCKVRAGEWYDNVEFDIWAYRNELSVEAGARYLFSTGGQATVMLRRISLFSADSQARSAAGCFALSSQERITLFVCFCGALKRGLRCLFSGLHSQARGASVILSGIR